MNKEERVSIQQLTTHIMKNENALRCAAIQHSVVSDVFVAVK